MIVIDKKILTHTYVRVFTSINHTVFVNKNYISFYIYVTNNN